LVDTRIGVLFTQAYPDVSAQSRRFLIWYQGQGALLSGTSASAPTFAAIVALLNDAMLAKGRPPLGFLNPLLYSKGAAAGFNDITSGNAPGCGTPGFNVRLLSFSRSFFPVSSFLFEWRPTLIACAYVMPHTDLLGLDRRRRVGTPLRALGHQISRS